MSLKDTWIDKRNLVDDIYAEDINAIARQAIENYEELQKKADLDEAIINTQIIVGNELDDLTSGLPEYMKPGSIIFFKQDYENYNDNAPFGQAIVYSLENEYTEIELGVDQWQQIAIAVDLLGEGSIWTRSFNAVFGEWKKISLTDSGGGSLAGEIIVDTDLTPDSDNPIANSTVYEAIRAVNEDLNKKANIADVFLESNFKWTDFEYTLPDDATEQSYVSDNVIKLGGVEEPIVIHCTGKTLGFTFNVQGFSDASITINGQTTNYINSLVDGSTFVENIVVPLTYMESDIVFSGGMNTWNFENMISRKIKGTVEGGSSGEPIDLTNYVRKTDYANSEKSGVIKVSADNGFSTIDGQLTLVSASEDEINTKDKDLPITTKNVEYAVKAVGNKIYAKAAQLGEIDVALDKIIEIYENQVANLPNQEKIESEIIEET